MGVGERVGEGDDEGVGEGDGVGVGEGVSEGDDEGVGERLGVGDLDGASIEFGDGAMVSSFSGFCFTTRILQLGEQGFPQPATSTVRVTVWPARPDVSSDRLSSALGVTFPLSMLHL